MSALPDPRLRLLIDIPKCMGIPPDRAKSPFLVYRFYDDADETKVQFHGQLFRCVFVVFVRRVIVLRPVLCVDVCLCCLVMGVMMRIEPS